jgi:4-aminobutyrate aminotransferase/(S)-3-amino-2-methylpropionate transaminase
MLTGGIYYSDDVVYNEPYRVFNTWLGDPSKVILLEELVRTIWDMKLLDNARKTGAHILDGLTRLEGLYPDQLSQARGVGLYCAIDARDTILRDRLLTSLRNRGIHIGGNGERSIRLRPSLIFQRQHADIFLDKLEQAVVENK